MSWSVLFIALYNIWKNCVDDIEFVASSDKVRIATVLDIRCGLRDVRIVGDCDDQFSTSLEKK